MKIAVYDAVSGEIIRMVVCPEPLDQLEEGEAFLVGDAIPADEYVVAGLRSPRPSLGVADEYVLAVDEVAHLSVPEGTEVSCEGIEVVADADGIDLSFATSGSYVVKLRPPFPFKPTRVSVEVA